MSKGCLWSLLLLSVDEGECEEYFSFWSHRKTVRKHYMRPRTPHQARSQCWIAPGTPHSQRLLTGLRGLRVGLLMLLFWFLPRPGTVAICDSCILALRWLWPLFISDFFFFFQWISSCFSRYSTWMKKRRYCLKVSWTCSRSGTSCSRLGRGTLWRVCVPGVDCTDASEIPKQYRAWFVSITQELKKPVGSGNKMSAGGATAAIQLEMDNTFGPVFLRSACFHITVNSPVSSACGEQPLSV